MGVFILVTIPTTINEEGDEMNKNKYKRGVKVHVMCVNVYMGHGKDRLIVRKRKIN